MATIIAELYFLDRGALVKPVYISRNKWRCKDTFVRVENFWCYQAFPHLRFSASWLCPVDLQHRWMAEMPSVWFRSCYSFKIFSTCEIFFHLCFNGNRGLQNCPAPWGWSHVPSTLLTHLESRFCSTAARSGKPSQQSMKGIWRTRWVCVDCGLVSGSQPILYRNWSSNLAR